MLFRIAFFRPALWLSCFLFLLTSCGEPPEEKQKGAGPERSSASGSLSTTYPEWRAARYSDYELRRKDYNPILHGIVREQYANLDPFVERFDEFYRCGTSVREVFVRCFEGYHQIGGSGAATYFSKYEKNLRTWVEMKPDSQVPILALAGLMQSQAWLSRGGDVADKVTEEGWKGFAEDLQRSRALLENAPDFVRNDPSYWKQLMSIGLGQGVSKKEMRAFFREGQKRDPLYLPLYEEMVWYLEPRWYGESPSEWHGFLSGAIQFDGLSEEDRKMIYGVIVRYVLRGREEYLRWPEETFEAMGVDVPMFIEGLGIYTRRYPESSQWPIHYFYHAEKANHVEGMKDAIDLAEREYDGYNYDPEDLYSFFERAVKKFPELSEPLGRVE